MDIFSYLMSLRLRGLHDHSPVKKEPKDRFHIVVELVPPPVVLWLILQFVWINEYFDFLRKVVHSLRVGIGIAFRTFWYRRNIFRIIEWHWSPPLNSSCDEDRCPLVKTGLSAAQG
jgi:hypothetical protein